MLKERLWLQEFDVFLAGELPQGGELAQDLLYEARVVICYLLLLHIIYGTHYHHMVVIYDM